MWDKFMDDMPKSTTRSNMGGNPADTNEISEKKHHTKWWFLVLVLVIAAFASSIMYPVNENEFAYVTRFSKMVDAHDNTGVNFKMPVIDKVTKIPSYQMMYDIPPSEVITKDKKTLVIDNFAIWKVEDPVKYMQTVRGSRSEMENRISAAVYSAVKNEFGRLQRDEIISTDPSSVERVSVRVTDQVDKSLESYGISVTSVEIKKTDLPDANADAVYERMIAERNQIAASYIAEGNLEAAKIRNDVDQQVAVIIAEAEAAAAKRRGEAEAEYMKILASAYGNPEKASFYEFMRHLEALETSFKGNTTLVLDESSEVVQALLGK